MPSPSLQIWWYVKLVMLDVGDGTSTTYYLSQRPIIDDVNYGRYIPILKSVTGLGNRMDTYLPQPVSGSITLSNAPNSFGFERCFGDLLERQTPIGQSIELYMAKTTLDDMNVTADFSLQWKSKVSDVKYTFDGTEPTISLSVASEVIPRRVLTKAIDTTNFPNAQSFAVGKYLPIVFGASVDVKPTCITASGSSSPQYAYGTNLDTKFVNGGVTAYYVKDVDSNYSQIDSPAATSTYIYSDDLSGYTYDSAVLSNELGVNDYRAVDIEWSSSARYVAVQGFVVFSLAAAATLYGNITFELWEKDNSRGGPGRRVGYGKIDKADITWSTVGSNTVEFCFDQPVPLTSSKGYFFAVTQSATNGTANLRTARYTSAPTDTYWLNSSGAWYKWVNTVDGDPPKMHWALYGAKFTDSPSGGAANADGLGHSYFTVTQRSTGSSATAPDLGKLDMVTSVNGLIDDGSGSVSGTINASLQAPLHALIMLGYSWNGSSWVQSLIDTTKFSSYQSTLWSTASGKLRYLKGATNGRRFVDEILGEICKNSGARLALYNNSNGYLGIWGWGTENTPGFTIDSERARVISVDHLGLDSVVNRLTIFYDYTLRVANPTGSLIYCPVGEPTNPTANITGQFRDFLKALEWYNGANDQATFLTSRSETLYGKRVLNDATYQWLGDQASAEHMAHYILATYALPQKYITVDVPYDLYSTIDMLDVGYLILPNLPSFFGSSISAKLPTYSKAGVDIYQGGYSKRASRYRVQVEGREVNWNVNDYPTLTLTCRWLDNYPADPT